jgi:protein-disulfide isomerase
MKFNFKDLGILLLLSGQAFCQNIGSQIPVQPGPITLDRRIELIVRSEYDVPSNCDIKIGSRTSSSVPGYDQLQVTIQQGQRNITTELLISSDNRKLGRLETFDLNHIPSLSIDVQGRPIRGNPGAQVTVIDFDDLECPVCAYLHSQLFPAALSRYGDKVRFIYLDNPLVEIHPWALRAAVDATCLANEDSNAYWNYVDYIHAHVQEVTGETRNLQRSFAELDKVASDQAEKDNLNSHRLQACLTKQNETPVRQSMKQAADLELNFTPALFVNGEEVHGFTSIDDVWKVIDRALRESEAETKKAATN